VVAQLSPESRRAFLDAAWMGDGTLNHGQKLIIQNPGPKADAIKLAVFLEGFHPLVTREEDRKCELIRYGKPYVSWAIKQEPAGHGAVWCPQTACGTWVMRQGDEISITGNCYWLFPEPFILESDEDRRAAMERQAAWVEYVGADPASKDLARVLRVPGTRNIKYQPAPLVTIKRDDYGAS
jgi:hypothetical protein